MKAKERMKRFLAILLVFAMLMTSSSMNVLAATIVVGGVSKGEAQQPAETEAQDEVEAEQPETNADGSQVRKNLVTFHADEHASVHVDGQPTGNTAYAKDGKIVFNVLVEDGYQIASVIVDGSVPARTTEDGASYIIEGILTDSTTVDVTTQAVETEAAVEESESESETETESETEAEAAMPERNFAKSFSEFGGVTVHIHVPEGVLAEDCTIDVTPASREEMLATAEAQKPDEDMEVLDVIGFNIVFSDAEGNEIHDLDDKVEISYSGLDIPDEATVTATHIDENGAAESLTTTEVSSNSVGFTSDSFTVQQVTIYGASPLAIEGPKTVMVGETISLKCELPEKLTLVH